MSSRYPLKKAFAGQSSRFNILPRVLDLVPTPLWLGKHCLDPICLSFFSMYQPSPGIFRNPTATINAKVCTLVKSAAYLPISPLLNDLSQGMYRVFGVRCRFDYSCLDCLNLLEKVSPESYVSFLEFDCSLHCAPRCFDRLMTGIVFFSSNDGRIYSLKSMNKALLCTKYVSPGVPPCFRALNDL